MKKLTLAAIGCGNRNRIYMTLASKMPDRYEIVAAADPNPVHLDYVKGVSNNPDFRSFTNDKELLAEDKFCDVIIIGTQDSYHYEPCKAALLKGYDVLLEKPISPSIAEIIELQDLAKKLGRRLQVCYVLRYTPFYRKVKEIVDSDSIGEIISINANEGVIPWHQAHSYVRGNWNQAEQSSPMIVAKCCHDTDIISWLLGKNCESVSSYGDLTHFRKDKAPSGAEFLCLLVTVIIMVILNITVPGSGDTPVLLCQGMFDAIQNGLNLGDVDPKLVGWIYFAIRVFILTFAPMIVWIPYAFIRSKKPSESAIAFYKKIRISSFGWKLVEDQTGVKAPRGEFKLNFIGWIVTSLALYGILLGTGSVIFHQWTQAIVYLPIGIIGSCYTWKIMSGDTFANLAAEGAGS